MQRIVDGGERDRHFGAVRLLIEHFRRHVPVALGEQDPTKRHTLPGRTQADAPQLRLDVMPRTSGEGALLRQPLLCERSRRKSDRQWRLHNEPCFITHSFSAPPGRSLQTKSIYDSFPCRNRRSPAGTAPALCGCGMGGCAFAPLCQYVSESKHCPEIAELTRGCRNAARISTMRTSSRAGEASCLRRARSCRCRRC